MNKTTSRETASLEPNYLTECCACGRKPTIVLVTKTKRDVTELCGVCFFGEARMLDIEEWEK